MTGVGLRVLSFWYCRARAFVKRSAHIPMQCCSTARGCGSHNMHVTYNSSLPLAVTLRLLMDRANKARRLCELRSELPFVSQRALTALLRVVHEVGVPHCGRDTIRQSRDSMVLTDSTPYGPLHQEIVVEGMDVEVCNPFAALWYAANHCPAFTELLDRAGQHKQPWNIVLYADEVLPGNQLAHKSERKTWCWYWSIAEFGPAALSSEELCVVQ